MGSLWSGVRYVIHPFVLSMDYFAVQQIDCKLCGVLRQAVCWNSFSVVQSWISMEFVMIPPFIELKNSQLEIVERSKKISFTVSPWFFEDWHCYFQHLERFLTSTFRCLDVCDCQIYFIFCLIWCVRRFQQRKHGLVGIDCFKGCYCIRRIIFFRWIYGFEFMHFYRMQLSRWHSDESGC